MSYVRCYLSIDLVPVGRGRYLNINLSWVQVYITSVLSQEFNVWRKLSKKIKNGIVPKPPPPGGGGGGALVGLCTRNMVIRNGNNLQNGFLGMDTIRKGVLRNRHNPKRETGVRNWPCKRRWSVKRTSTSSSDGYCNAGTSGRTVCITPICYNCNCVVWGQIVSERFKSIHLCWHGQMDNRGS